MIKTSTTPFPLAASPRAAKYGVRQERTAHGETAVSLARRLGVAADELMRANPHVFGDVAALTPSSARALLSAPLRGNLIIVMPRPAGLGSVDRSQISEPEMEACNDLGGRWVLYKWYEAKYPFNENIWKGRCELPERVVCESQGHTWVFDGPNDGIGHCSDKTAPAPAPPAPPEPETPSLESEDDEGPSLWIAGLGVAAVGLGLLGWWHTRHD